jgi:hypothetical protein
MIVSIKSGREQEGEKDVIMKISMPCARGLAVVVMQLLYFAVMLLW